MSESEYVVVDRPEDHRFVLEQNGEELGFAEYRREDGVITFTHTVVDPGHQGQGLGGRLARGALDDVRDASEDRVVPQCSFIADYIRGHEEYAPLLDR